MSDSTDSTPILPSSSSPMEFIGGRKFTLSMLVVVLTSLLCWFNKIDQGIYSVVIVAVVGAYITGNVVQKSTK